MKTILRIHFILFFLLITQSVFAGPGQDYNFDFDQVRLQDLTATVASITGSHFIIDSQSEILVSWIQEKVTKDQVIESFLDVVRSSGYIVSSLPSGVYRIHSNTIKVPGSSQGIGVFPLEHITPAEVSEAITVLYGEKVASAPSGDKVIVTGPDSLLTECSDLVRRLNIPGPFQVQRIPIEHVSIRSIVDSLTASQMVPEGSFFPDPWNRSIIFQGTPSNFMRFKLAVSSFDVMQTGIVDRLVYIHSLDPEKIIPVVAALAQPVQIYHLADNRVLLSGPSPAVTRAENLLHEMDGSDYQVRVEAVVAYLTDSEYDEIGAKLSYTGSNLVATLNDGLPGSLLGGSSGLLLEWFTSSFGITASAQKGKGHGRVVSSPVLFCGNGQPAKISVGQNVPFVTNYNIDSETGKRTGTDISREDIGVSLVITPVIERQGDFVRLQISQEVSSVAPESELSQNAVDIVTDQQLIESVVTVANGETIILGGSKRDEFGESKTFIPVLGHLFGWIPGLDTLLSYKNTTHETLHLVVSLRVKVIERRI